MSMDPLLDKLERQKIVRNIFAIIRTCDKKSDKLARTFIARIRTCVAVAPMGHTRNTTLTARLGRVALDALICYFAIFTAACWICDVFFTAAFGVVGFWLGIFPSQGLVLTPIVTIVSVFAWRWSRRLAVVGFLSCLMFMIWVLLPRL